MKRLGKPIAYSIAIGFVLIAAIFIIATYLMGYNVGKRKNGKIDNRDKIIERIESYISANGRLPESLSCVGFEQTYGGYAFKGISFDYIRFNDKEYVIEYTSEDGVLTQYISEEHRWTEEPDIYYIELPINAGTIAAINRISTFEEGYNIAPQIDSVSYNHSQICPIGDYIGMPDSVAYIPIYIKMAVSGVKDGLHTQKILKMISAMSLESGNITTSRVTVIASSGITDKTTN